MRTQELKKKHVYHRYARKVVVLADGSPLEQKAGKKRLDPQKCDRYHRGTTPNQNSKLTLTLMLTALEPPNPSLY